MCTRRAAIAIRRDVAQWACLPGASKSMFRSFPRKRESRAKYAGPSVLPWIPAFAGMSGVDIALIPFEHPQGDETDEIPAHNAARAQSRCRDAFLLRPAWPEGS